MKKSLSILIAILLSLSSIAVSADTSYSYGISLCYDGDAYSVDYVFSVPTGVEVLSVSVNDENYFCDWNYVKSEARLYLSIASENVIAKDDSIAKVNVVTNKEKHFLEPVSVVVNGSIKENVSAYHATVSMDWVRPGFDTPGQIGGEKCPLCGVVLVEPEPVSPTGPKVKTFLDENGTLTVSGGLSDNPIAKGTTFISVYDKNKRMLTLTNITVLDQSDFTISIENMKDAYTIKVLRWNAVSLRPLNDKVEISIKSE